MPDETDTKRIAEASSAPVNIAQLPFLTYQLPRNPCIFTGDDQQDAGKWLKDFQRIATYNHWDEQMCLANVIFYLAGTARQWFDNNEDNFTTWTVFKNSLDNTFCRTDDIRRQSERQLLLRAQHIGETTESYIQDVLALCLKANPSMPEDEKVAHLMKGISEDLYQILLVQDYETVDAFVKRCRQIESLRRRRVTRPKFPRLPNVSSVASETEFADLGSLVRAIVREELQKILPEVQCYTNEELDTPTDVASVVREEVLEALAPLTERRRRHTALRSPAPPVRPQPRSEARASAEPQRKTDLWRNSNNIPLCYHCGRPGHVLRYCRERRRTLYSRQIRNPRRNEDFSRRNTDDTNSLYSLDDNHVQSTSSNFRSNSPYPRRFSNRRQSQSPVRRSSRSPRHEEN